MRSVPVHLDPGMCAESGGLPERIRPGGEFGQAALMGLDKYMVDPVADGVVQQALQPSP